jgi:hypothetical protein
MLILYVTAVTVAIILRHQERRHQAELALVYERIGRPVPLRRPKLQKHVSWMNLAVGAIVVIVGSVALAANIAVAKDGLPVSPGQWEFSAVLLATGLTLCILGVRSLQENKRYEHAVRDQGKA